MLSSLLADHRCKCIPRHFPDFLPGVNGPHIQMYLCNGFLLHFQGDEIRPKTSLGAFYLNGILKELFQCQISVQEIDICVFWGRLHTLTDMNTCLTQIRVSAAEGFCMRYFPVHISFPPKLIDRRGHLMSSNQCSWLRHEHYFHLLAFNGIARLID